MAKSKAETGKAESTNSNAEKLKSETLKSISTLVVRWPLSQFRHSRIFLWLSNPAHGAIDRRDDLPPPLGGHRAAPRDQGRLWERVEQVTLADRWPVQPVAGVQNHFVRFGRTRRRLAAAQ